MKDTIKAIIVDDEALARENLELTLKENCPDVFIIGKAGSVAEAKTLIENLEPNLVFLDIEMPEENGFSLLEQLDQINFDLIFATAHDQYAIKAIKYSALDYILKPIDGDELKSAIKKVKHRRTLANPEIDRQIQSLLENINKPESFTKIAFPVFDGVEYVNVEDIMYCQSDRNYTIIQIKDRDQLVISKTLSDVQALLPEEHFLRLHKSYLVNQNFITKYVKTLGSFVVMEDGAEITVSRRRKSEIDALFK